MQELSTTWAMIVTAFTSPWNLAAIGAKFMVYASSLLASGLMLFRLALPKAGDEVAHAMRALAMAAVFIAVLATMARVLVQAGRLMDDGLSGMFDPEIIMISLEGPLGQSTYVRLLGLGLILIAIVSRALRVPATLFGTFLIAGSFALTGHATREPQWLLAGLITFHIVAISYWWGALTPLHRLAATGQDRQHAADIAHQFGRQATIIVPMLIIAGGAFAWLLLGHPFELLTTNYGRVLLLKLTLVAGILAIAALNKVRLVPALANDVNGSASRFRRSLRVESGVFVLVFAATALLTTSFTVPTQ